METKHSVKNGKPVAKEFMVVDIREIEDLLKDDSVNLKIPYSL